MNVSCVIFTLTWLTFFTWITGIHFTCLSYLWFILLEKPFGCSQKLAGNSNMDSWVFKQVLSSSFLASWILSFWLYSWTVMQLPAILSLSTKFVPTVMNILKRLADEGQRPAAGPERQREMELQPKPARNGSSYSNVTSAGSSSVTTSEIGPEYSSPVAQWSSGSSVFWLKTNPSSWC